MKNIFVITIIVCACFINQSHSQTIVMDDQDSLLSKVWAKMTLKDYSGVIKDCDECLEKKEVGIFYLWRAKAKYKLKDLNGALQDYEAAENSYGILYEEVGDLKCLLKDFSGALISYSDYSYTYNLRGSDKARLCSKMGYVMFMLKDYRGAVIDYTLSIALDSMKAKRYKDTELGSNISEEYLCIFEDFKNNIENYTYSLPPELKDFNFNRSDRKNTLISFMNILDRDYDLYKYFITQKSGTFDLECFRSIAADLHRAIGLIEVREDEESVGSIPVAKYVLEDYQGALINFTEAIMSDPTNMSNYYWRAKTKVKLSDIQGAIKDLNTVLETSPISSREAAYFCGELKDSIKDYEGALSAFSKAIQINENSGDAYEKRGNIEYKIKRYREAIADYSKSIEIDSKKAEVFIGRGLAKIALLDYRGAIADFTNAIAIDPKNASFYNDRALAKYQIKDTNGACLDWSKAGELGNENAYEMIKKYCQ